MTILESARKVVDGYVIDAPRKLDIDDNDFVEHVLTYGPVLGQAADIATTMYALRSGLVEANPFAKGLVKNMPLFSVLKIAVGVGSSVIASKMENKRTKKAFLVATTLLGLGPAISNIHQIRK